MTRTSPMIEAEGVKKAFGKAVALAGVDIHVDQGTVLSLLGRNGAGKTTFVRILSTLLAADAGRVRLAGVDVRRDPATVRSLIGLAGQFAAVDEMMTGRENLELVGRLYGVRRREARARADEVLERLGLTDAAGRLEHTYSGGMRRRLDLGASLVGRPLILILDEPSTGLDPRSRVELWGLIDQLVGSGTTLLLTTQYLEEADRLADRVAVVERGRMIADGTPGELKRRIGGDVLEVRATHSHDVERLVGVLRGLGPGQPVADLRAQRVTLPTTERVPTLLAAARRIEDSGIPIVDLGVRGPSLDDVFLTLTGGAVPPLRAVPEAPRPAHRDVAQEAGA
ncbi:MAG: type transport system ATP-binding protein [Solirubrobacteraceae bacterium]|nr:type transport system ATP-binding protein [Solirubrobacteraceae bacterium]